MVNVPLFEIKLVKLNLTEDIRIFVKRQIFPTFLRHIAKLKTI